MSNPKIEVLPIERGAQPDPNNVNKHTQRGRGLHENSMRKRGAGRSIFSAGKGVDVPVVMGGNQTLEIAAQLDMEIINVHTTGNQIVNVVRDDIEPNSPEFYALGIEDNEVGRISYAPDVEVLAAIMSDPSVNARVAEDKMLADIVEGMSSNTAFGNTSTDRDGQGVSSTWGQVKTTENQKIIIGDIESRLSVDVYVDVRKFIETQNRINDIPVYDIIENIFKAGLAHYENFNS